MWKEAKKLKKEGKKLKKAKKAEKLAAEMQRVAQEAEAAAQAATKLAEEAARRADKVHVRCSTCQSYLQLQTSPPLPEHRNELVLGSQFPRREKSKTPRPRKSRKITQKLQFGPPQASSENYRKNTKKRNCLEEISFLNYTF